MKTGYFYTKSPFFIPVLVFVPLFSLLLYINSLDGEFVYDDFKIIVDNGFIKDWKYFLKIFTKDFFSISGEMSYRPLVTISYFMDYEIWELNPFGFHLTNILLHAVNTTLFYLFLQFLLNNRKALWFSTLFFVTHPILTETVNAIGYREDLMSAAFILISLIFYMKSEAILSDKNKGKNSFVFCYAVSLIAYAFALFSKEMAVMFPAVLLLLVIFSKQNNMSGILSRLRGIYTGYIIVTIFYLIIRFVVLNNPFLNTSYKAGGFWVNFFTMIKVMASYVKLSFFPFNLNADYVVPLVKSPFELSSILSVVFLISIFVIFIRLFKTGHIFAFWMAWFFIMLIPVMNLIPIGNIMAERYLYIPVIGFCAAKGLLIDRITDRTLSPRALPLRRTVQLILVFFMICGNSIFIINRNGVWRDEFTLWTKTLERSPKSHRAHCNLGNVYLENGGIKRAHREYKTALQLNPENASVHSNLGMVYNKLGIVRKAAREYKEAIRLDNYYAQPHNNLGNIYYNEGLFDKAKTEYEEALRIKPDYSHAHNGLGSVYNSKGNLDKALEEFRKSLYYDNTYIHAINNLGVNYAKRGLLNKAVATFERAVKIDESQLQSYYNLGYAYEKLGKTEMAVRAYQKMLQLKPNNFKALSALGNLYYDQGKKEEAIRIFKKILTFYPETANAYKMLAFLYLFEKKDWEQSELYLERLLELEPSQAQDKHVKQALNYIETMRK